MPGEQTKVTGKAYIKISSLMTADTYHDRAALTKNPGEFIKLVNYIPSRGQLTVRAGVTEFSFVAA